MDEKRKHDYFPQLIAFFAVNPQASKPDEQQFQEGDNVSIVTKLKIGVELGYLPWVEDALNKILASSTKGEELIDLLAAKNHRGKPVLCFAWGDGFHDIIHSYSQSILDADLTNDEKINLLAAQDLNGSSGLLSALFYGHDKTISVFMNCIINTVKLTNEQKIKLLTPNKVNNIAGLQIALAEGHDKTVAVFVNNILNAEIFTDEQKVELLAPDNSNDFSGLELALLKGYKAAASEFIFAIQDSALSETQKDRLLAPFYAFDGQTFSP